MNTVANPEGERNQRGTKTVKRKERKVNLSEAKIKHLTFWVADQFSFFEINGILEAYFCNSCTDL